MSKSTSRIKSDRGKIDLSDKTQMRHWAKEFGVPGADVLAAVGKVGKAVTAVRKELATTPLKPDDFPLHPQGEQTLKEDGTPITQTVDPAVAVEMSARLNEDEARREEDKWSA